MLLAAVCNCLEPDSCFQRLLVAAVAAVVAIVVVAVIVVTANLLC